jgi:hypothetical protein
MTDFESKNIAKDRVGRLSGSDARTLLWATVVVIAVSLGSCSGSCGSCCLPDEVDVPDPAGPTGDIRITVTNFPSPESGRIFLDGRFEGTSGSNNFSRDINIEIAGPGHSEEETFSNQPTGSWSVTARTDPAGDVPAWSATCTGTVSEGVTVTFAFVFGQSGCTTS